MATREPYKDKMNKTSVAKATTLRQKKAAAARTMGQTEDFDPNQIILEENEDLIEMEGDDEDLMGMDDGADDAIDDKIANE